MKKIIAVFLFLSIFMFSFAQLNEVVIEKNNNRFYMLESELASRNESYDVQIFGSCHTYTAFNSSYFSDKYGMTSYNMANPGEIIPSTYLRMLNQFNRQIPKVAIVDIWGINAFDTYQETEELFNVYFAPNIELLPVSKEKLEVINDFESLDIINENIPISKYKDRIIEFKLNEVDFDYSFVKAKGLTENDGNWSYLEMENRFQHNGYYSRTAKDLSVYKSLQKYVNDDELLEIEPSMMKYIKKIIELCEDNEVKLVFIRSPYISKETELKKANYLREFLISKDIPYFDLEKELTFDYSQDFNDGAHLSNYGAEKVTNYLGDRIMDLLDKDN